MRWTLTNQGGGYYRVDGAIYPGLLLVLREIAESERDDLLRWFAGARLEDEAQDKTWRWIMSHSNAKRGDRKLEELEGYDELVQSFLATLKPEQRLAGLDPKDRLAGLDPKDRLAGLGPKDVLAEFDPKAVLAEFDPKDRLAGLEPDEAILAIDSLPEAVREMVIRSVTKHRRRSR